MPCVAPDMNRFPVEREAIYGCAGDPRWLFKSCPRDRSTPFPWEVDYEEQSRLPSRNRGIGHQSGATCAVCGTSHGQLSGVAFPLITSSWSHGGHWVGFCKYLGLTSSLCVDVFVDLARDRCEGDWTVVLWVEFGFYCVRTSVLANKCLGSTSERSLWKAFGWGCHARQVCHRVSCRCLGWTEHQQVSIEVLRWSYAFGDMECEA